MEYATERIIDSVWTTGYELTGKDTVTIHTHDRRTEVGYLKEGELPRVKLIQTEDGKRTITHLWITDGPVKWHEKWSEVAYTVYTVDNPKHIFDYR